MTDNSFRSREERVLLVGALLSKGVTLLLSRERPSPPTECPRPRAEGYKAPPKATNEMAVLLDDTEIAIMSFVQKVRDASPRDIQNAVDLPKTTTFRKLTRLVVAGLLMRSGKTTAIRYRINGPSEERKKDSRKFFPSPGATLNCAAITGKQKSELIPIYE